MRKGPAYGRSTTQLPKTSTWGRAKVREIPALQELAAARKGMTERCFSRKKHSTGSKTEAVEATVGPRHAQLSKGRGPPPEGTAVAALKATKAGFPGGAVVESLPANEGDAGSSPGLGRSHMPRSN